MSTIHMIRSDVRFNRFTVLGSCVNTLMQQEIISFPSNVISCSFMIADLDCLRANALASQDKGAWSSFGAGVRYVSYVGTNVYFTAWMTLREYVGGALETTSGFLSPDASWLTVQAIAECE